ncbi:MAG: hypothetical protein K2L07_04300 [Lachnospiraceae bacterium]|nr:hypothetical protein [Lachnospiraceae bacterium]
MGDIGSSQSLNRYAYCEGNPVSMVDPFGLCGESANDQGQGSKYEKWHDLLGVAGMFWDGFDLINGVLYAMEGDYVNAAISFACGIPAVGNIIAGVAKVGKAVKAIKTAEKIAGMCRAIGKIGNTAAAVKACYDTYQTAQRECKTTTGKIAYMAGTLAAGYLMGKAANWGAGKLKNLASKAMPKLKTAVKEAAGKLVSRFNKGFGSSGSGHMNRNRGFAINPFYKGGGDSKKQIPDQKALHDLAKECVKRAKNGNPISEAEAKILDEWALEYNVPQHHQAYSGSGEHFPGGDYSDHTHIYNIHVPYKPKGGQ